MLILQFRFIEINEQERELIPEFCNWICEQLYEKINTSINRAKINTRIKYLYTVEWIKWISNKYTTVDTIFNTIQQSFIGVELRDNTWNIRIDDNIKLPKTNTAISRIIRFINYGNDVILPTGIFTKLINEYNHFELNTLWRYFILDKLDEITNSSIIA